MAVQSDTSRIQYAGNNSTSTSYAVPFVFLENSHLKAIARTSAGVETVVTLTNHTGAGDVNGGTVRTAVAVPATSTLTIYREVPATQTTTYAEGGDFPAASHERALDKLTQIAQQLERKVGSAIRLSEATQLPELNPPLTNQQHILSSVGGAAPSWQALPSLSIGPVIATGSTAARSVQDRFADVVNVKDFGAVGDGVTDDRAAIQAAIDAAHAAGGGEVFLPKGIYRLSGNLLAKNKVRMRGVLGSSELRKDQGVFAEMLTNPLQASNIPVEDFSLENLIWNANSNGTETFAATAVNLTGAVRVYIRGCTFKNATGYGLGFQGQPGGSFTGLQDEIWIENCVFENNGKSALVNVYDGLDMKSSNKMTIKNVILRDNGNEGATLRGVDMNVDGVLTYNNGVHGLNILAGTNSGAQDIDAKVNISNVHSYGNGGRGITVSMSAAGAACFNRTTISNVHSHDNALDGFLVTEGISSQNNFEVTLTNAILRNNGSHGLQVGIVNPKAFIASNVVTKGNVNSGIVNLANNAVFLGCVATDNGWYGYDSGSPVTTTGNQFVGGLLENNTLGNVRGSGAVSIIGVTGSNSLRGSHFQGAVNFMQVEGRTSGGSPSFSSQGADTNVNFSLSTKGTGIYRIWRDNFNQELLRISGNGANLTDLQCVGSDADADLRLVPQGSGNVRYGTHAAITTETLSGFITIKDAAGNARKVAVVS